MRAVSCWLLAVDATALVEPQNRERSKQPLPFRGSLFPDTPVRTDAMRVEVRTENLIARFEMLLACGPLHDRSGGRDLVVS